MAPLLSKKERFARYIVLKPWTSCCFSFGIIFVLMGIVGAAGWLEIQDFGSNDWQSPDSEGSLNYDAYEIAFSQSSTAEFFLTVPVPFRSVQLFQFNPIILYSWSDKSRTDDIFTPENLKAICEFERIIYGDDEFKTLCFTNDAEGDDTVCQFNGLPIVSAAFYGDFESMTRCDLLNDTEVETTRSVLLLNQQTRFFFSKAIEQDITANSPITRTLLPFGAPLGSDTTGDENLTLPGLFDLEHPSIEFYDEFLLRVVETMDEVCGLENSLFRSQYQEPALLGEDGQLEVRYFSDTWNGLEFDNIFNLDLTIVIVSVALVGALIFYHTKSCFITSAGLGVNMSSIPVALFFYRAFLQIEYFTPMHIIILFLIIGIGADNLFVFYDAWILSKDLWFEMTPEDDRYDTRAEAGRRNRFGTGDAHLEVTIYRLRYTISRATGSIFNTMSTTFFAFLATSFNPLAPVSGFGIFASIVILCNYTYTFMFYGPIMLIFYRRLPSCCFCLNKKADENAETEMGTEKQDKADEEESKADDELKGCAFEFRLVRQVYLPTMKACSPWLQIFLIVGNLTYFALMATFALKLELPIETDEFFGEDHMYFNFFSDTTDKFAGGQAEDAFIEVDWTFGIKAMSREGFDRYDPNGFRGTPVFDEEFDIAPSENQKFYLQICEELKVLSCIPEGDSEPLDVCSGPDPSLIVFPDTLTCILEDFYAFMGGDAEAVQTLGDDDPDAFYDALRNFSISGEDISQNLGFYEDELKFITVKFFLSYQFLKPILAKLPAHDILFDLLDEKIEAAPVGLESQKLASLEFAFVDGEKELIPGLVEGLSIAFSFAFLILLYGTDNIILAVFAIISIIGIVISLLGTIQLLGYQLGYLQTIAAIMVVGLSVDYTVHIGHTYEVAAEEGYKTRREKFEIAAYRMGPTVVMGFVTTAASAGVMLFCQLQLFPIMGEMILITIAYSLEVALCFYLSLLLLFGPENDTGTLSKWFTCFKKQQKKNPLESSEEGEAKPGVEALEEANLDDEDEEGKSVGRMTDY